MRNEGRNRTSGSRSSVGLVLRKVGRVAIWFVLGLILIRGVVSTATPESTAQSPGSRTSSAPDDHAADAFAVRFARTFLTNPSAQALAPLLAEGAPVPSGTPAVSEDPAVEQAEVSAVEVVDPHTSILTVACELRDARTLYIAVPITRSPAGEVAALGAPSIVAPPGLAGAEVDRPRPVTGSDATAIEALAAQFLPEYLSADDPAALSYLVEPGVTVQPLGGPIQFGSLAGVTQLGDAEGSRRSILVAIRATDPASGAGYPLTYRLDLVKDARWYVRAVEGESA